LYRDTEKDVKHMKKIESRLHNYILTDFEKKLRKLIAEGKKEEANLLMDTHVKPSTFASPI